MSVAQWRSRWLPIVFLGSLLIGCDGYQPLDPEIEAARSGSGSLAAPSNTNALAVSDSRIDVSWQDNSGNETGFEVHRSTTGPGGVFVLLASTGAGVTTYPDVGLAHSTQYCYKVRAYRLLRRNIQYSDFSATACATTPVPPVPAAPSDTDVWPASSSEVVVRWTDNSSNEDGFRIERSLDAGSTWMTAFTVGRDSSWIWWSDVGRTSEQQVCYRVIAFNGGGDSPPSNTDCTTPPAGPTNLTATGVDAQTVDLSWTDNSAVEDGYDVWSDYELIASLEPNTTSLRLEGYDGWYFFSYIIVARKDGGESDWSNWAAPTAPPGASAVRTAGSTSRVRVSARVPPRVAGRP